MNGEPDPWPGIARRIVEGVGVRAGDLVLVRGGGDPQVLEEVLLAVEAAGATPVPEIAHAGYLRRLIAGTDPAHLATWDRHRREWLGRMDRVISLGGRPPDVADLPLDAVQAWEGAVARIGGAEASTLPFLVVAVPDAGSAEVLGLSLTRLEEILLPALAVPAAELQGEIDRVLAAATLPTTLTIETAPGCILRVDRGDRPWLQDDGIIDQADIVRGAVVSNLPAGSIYSTVIEESAEGAIYLPRAGPARDVTLAFAGGRVVGIEAAEGAAEIAGLLDRHSGESRRISHIGIGLNPRLREPTGWTIVDEHIQGALFLALGENRYMGGKNASSLNIDFTVSTATILAGDRVIVRDGTIMS